MVWERVWKALVVSLNMGVQYVGKYWDSPNYWVQVKEDC